MKDIKEVVEYIKKNRTDGYGNINLNRMDFGDASVSVSGMKVGGNLYQYGQMVKGNLYQDGQEVGGDLIQSFQRVQGVLSQYAQIAKSLSDEDKKFLSELVESSEEGAKEAKQELPKKGTKKYTLQEIYDKGFAIHCDTEEKAKKLCKALDKVGWKWCDGKKYTEDTRWWLRHKGTCYQPTVVGGHADIKWYKIRGIHVVEFGDVDLGEGE